MRHVEKTGRETLPALGNRVGVSPAPLYLLLHNRHQTALLSGETQSRPETLTGDGSNHFLRDGLVWIWSPVSPEVRKCHACTGPQAGSPPLLSWDLRVHLSIEEQNSECPACPSEDSKLPGCPGIRPPGRDPHHAISPIPM